MRYRIKTYNVTIAQDSQTSQNSVIAFSFGIPQYVKNQLVVRSGSPALDAASNKFVQQSIRLIADETRKGYVLCATGSKMTFRDAYYYVNSGNLQINFNYSALREAANGDTDDLAAIDAMTSNDQFTIELDWGESAEDVTSSTAKETNATSNKNELKAEIRKIQEIIGIVDFESSLGLNVCNFYLGYEDDGDFLIDLDNTTDLDDLSVGSIVKVTGLPTTAYDFHVPTEVDEQNLYISNDTILNGVISNLLVKTGHYYRVTGIYNLIGSSDSVIYTYEEVKLITDGLAKQGSDSTKSITSLDADLGDVAAALEYMQQGGMPQIAQIAKQGSNANANISEIQAKIGSPASGQPNTLFAAIAAGGGGGGAAVPQISVPDSGSAATQELAANTLYIFPNRTSDLTLTLGTPVVGDASEYHFIIEVGSALPTITLPTGLTWKSSDTIAFDTDTTYEVSILDNYAIFVIW